MALPPSLLRRHECRSPHHCTRLRRLYVRRLKLGQTEIRQIGRPGRIEKNVARFQVAVNAIRRMRMRQCLRNGQTQFRGFPGFERPLLQDFAQ